MQLVFLNTRSFVSKKGKDCHMVTFASSDGVVMDFFHDGGLDVGNLKPFTPVDVQFSYEPAPFGIKTKVTSVNVLRKEF